MDKFQAVFLCTKCNYRFKDSVDVMSHDGVCPNCGYDSGRTYCDAKKIVEEIHQEKKNDDTT